MKNLNDYSYPVHKTLLKRKLLMGIPIVPFIIIALTTLIILMDFKILAIIPIGIGLLWIVREITKKDDYLLDIIINSLSEPDFIN